MTFDSNEPQQPYASPNSYSWQDQTPQFSAQKQSGLGIASFVLAMLAGGGILGAILLAGVLAANDPAAVQENQGLIILIGLAVMAMGGLSFIGLALGIAGLFWPERLRLMAILGVLFNFLVITGIGGLMVIGMIAG